MSPETTLIRPETPIHPSRGSEAFSVAIAWIRDSTEDMSIPAVLRRAATAIETFGFDPDSYGDTLDGDGLVQGPMCLVGGVEQAIGISVTRRVPPYDLRGHEAAVRALSAMDAYLVTRHPGYDYYRDQAAGAFAEDWAMGYVTGDVEAEDVLVALRTCADLVEANSGELPQAWIEAVSDVTVAGVSFRRGAVLIMEEFCGRSYIPVGDIR